VLPENFTRHETIQNVAQETVCSSKFGKKRFIFAYVERT
jgi:hypothetical protein